ncbi:unnamed protein product [Kuraishia capsulata CBS 1993]|uniref:Probable NADPH dehydrogenase n=1 Tax=Kuraishia capsulata CBS 1993 TaxID=1382522 RepID=W6MPM0_9ASCO|nr:uncharacterized protein KUCA_T00004265001 [Kuraishia capsulata CBS 1993]CDK28283.1 unnamed protein product [Kuraishia capsulata CBS 1993]
MTAIAESNLFKPIKVGNVELSNRLVGLPTTRFRNSPEHVPTDAMEQLYIDRTRDAGSLIITEGTLISPKYGVYNGAPGLWSEAQTAGWKKIIEAVHKNGSFVSSQLWALGRVATPELSKARNLPLYGPSEIHFSEQAREEAEKSGVELHALSTEEVEQLVQDYVVAAENALEGAGADMVEIHAANGYLPNQFIEETSNQRTDKYGGSIENRSRFIMEVVDAIGERFGYERVGIRFTPWSNFQGMPSGDDARISPMVTYGYLLSEFERRAASGKRLAYILTTEPRVEWWLDQKGTTSHHNRWVYDIWKGVVIRSGGYFTDPSYSTLIEHVDANNRTLIGSARSFTSNPDLRSRIRKGQELTPFEREFFYTHTNYGYNTFGDYGVEKLGPDSEQASRPLTPLA